MSDRKPSSRQTRKKTAKKTAKKRRRATATNKSRKRKRKKATGGKTANKGQLQGATTGKEKAKPEPSADESQGMYHDAHPHESIPYWLQRLVGCIQLPRRLRPPTKHKDDVPQKAHRSQVQAQEGLRRLQQDLRSDIRACLKEEGLPPSWNPETDEKLREDLRKLSTEFGLQTGAKDSHDLAWLLLEAVPRSWSGRIDTDPIYYELRASIEGFADEHAYGRQHAKMFSLRFQLLHHAMRLRPTRAQMTAVVASVLGIFDESREEHEKYGQTVADRLEEIHLWARRAESGPRLAVLGSVWHQLWDEAGGFLLRTHSSLLPCLPFETNARPPHPFVQLLESCCAQLLDEGQLGYKGSLLARNIVGAPTIRKRDNADPNVSSRHKDARDKKTLRRTADRIARKIGVDPKVFGEIDQVAKETAIVLTEEALKLCNEQGSFARRCLKERCVQTSAVNRYTDFGEKEGLLLSDRNDRVRKTDELHFWFATMTE